MDNPKIMSAIDTLNNFDLKNIPDLDVAVEGALTMLTDAMLPDTDVPFLRPLVIGSGNAEHTGRIIFRDQEAYFANESNFEAELDRHPDLDGVVLISASGSKHSIHIAEHLKGIGLPTVLFTTNKEAPVAAFVGEENVRLFPKNREPYTYNTSTYFSMILSKTKEDPEVILDHIRTAWRDQPDLSAFDSFTFVLPSSLTLIAPMLRTKFDELFGTHLSARFFTPEEIKHAKTIVPNERELFISMTPEGHNWGEGGSRWPIDVPKGGFLEALAISYHLIGQIQKAHQPYFKNNLVRYCKEISRVFGQDINPIVE